MPLVPIPMGNGVTRNIDGIEVVDKDIQLIDAYFDEENGVVKRPGATLFQNLSLASGATCLPFSPIDGAFWWESQNALILVCAGELYKVTKSGEDYTVTYMGNPTAKLSLANRPTMALGFTYALFASGEQLVYSNALGSQNYITDVDAPKKVTHVANLDGFFLAFSVDTQMFYWSALNDPTSWDSLDMAQVVGNTDIIKAMYVVKRYIYFIGTASIEIWQNDGSTPFSRVDGGFIEAGTLSPYSIITSEDDLYWLSDKGKFLHFNGNSTEELLCPYQREIEKFKTVEDCTGDRIEISGQDFYVWNFKGANKTYVYNTKTKKWSEFGDYDADLDVYDKWLYNTYVYAKAWRLHIVGRKNAPIIDILSDSYYSDGDGSTIRPLHLTGQISNGTLQKKRVNFLRLAAKTGVDGGYLMFQYRDDDKPTWSNVIKMSLRSQGDSNLVLRKNLLGTYSRRQWKFYCTDNVPVVYHAAEIDVDFLGV